MGSSQSVARSGNDSGSTLDRDEAPPPYQALPGLSINTTNYRTTFSARAAPPRRATSPPRPTGRAAAPGDAAPRGAARGPQQRPSPNPSRPPLLQFSDLPIGEYVTTTGAMAIKRRNNHCEILGGRHLNFRSPGDGPVVELVGAREYTVPRDEEPTADAERRKWDTIRGIPVNVDRWTHIGAQRTRRTTPRRANATHVHNHTFCDDAAIAGLVFETGVNFGGHEFRNTNITAVSAGNGNVQCTYTTGGGPGGTTTYTQSRQFTGTAGPAPTSRRHTAPAPRREPDSPRRRSTDPSPNEKEVPETPSDASKDKDPFPRASSPDSFKSFDSLPSSTTAFSTTESSIPDSEGPSDPDDDDFGSNASTGNNDNAPFPRGFFHGARNVRITGGTFISNYGNNQTVNVNVVNGYNGRNPMRSTTYMY